MSKFMNYLWIVLLAVYIISPIDAHPLFLDDLMASGVLFYYLYKNAKLKKQQQYYDNYSQSQAGSQSGQNKAAGNQGPLTLEKAFTLMGVRPDAGMDEIGRAYKDKMSKSHPDKVSHLSEELQAKARELTLELNEAIDLIKRHKRL